MYSLLIMLLIYLCGSYHLGAIWRPPCFSLRIVYVFPCISPNEKEEYWVYTVHNTQTTLCICSIFGMHFWHSFWTPCGTYGTHWLTHSHSRVPLEILSATFILLKITWEWSQISQNIWRRFFVCLLINICHSNVFKNMLL